MCAAALDPDAANDDSDRASAGSLDPYLRRVAAVAIAATLLALVVLDNTSRGARVWWDRHSLTGSIVASLLVVGVTALVFDEVVARHQRRARASSVAAQAMILYAQARTAFDAVLASDRDAEDSGSAREELRSLAGLLLAASPTLYDDPTARVFLLRLQRVIGVLVQTLSASPAPDGPERSQLLAAEMAQLHTAMEPLRARLPQEYGSIFEDSA